MDKYQFTLNADTQHLDIHILTPRLEAAVISDFKQGLEKHWNTAIKTVTIDCNAVEFIDSSGIGALLSVQKKLYGQPVTLKNTKPAVMSVIELLRLHKVFHLD
jgi:anti-sigma B factor antagonist